MTPSQRQSITELAEAAHNARRSYDATRYWNMAGLSEDELRQQTVTVELLYTEMIEANGRLSAAQKAVQESSEVA